jgi:hypothetical protein
MVKALGGAGRSAASLGLRGYLCACSASGLGNRFEDLLPKSSVGEV